MTVLMHFLSIGDGSRKKTNMSNSWNWSVLVLLQTCHIAMDLENARWLPFPSPPPFVMESDPNSLRDPYKPVDDNVELPDLECAICFCQFNNVFNTPKVLQCKHTFCLECLARMNVKSIQPETIQCPLCRAYTPLPDFGLPKLANDSTVLSYLPAAMQHVYSIRFNRNKGKLQVKRVPSSAPALTQTASHTLDVGNPAGLEGQRGRDGGRERSLLMTVLRAPLCKAFIMSLVAIATVILTIVIIIINRK